MAAVIGALRVDLGLNSAQFTKGLKSAQTSLGKFGSVAARGFTALAAGATLAAGALGIAVKGAIDHADALSKASQKAGVTVEALSRLEYAAKLSDVSLEGLTGGLQKLSKGMADAAGGKGPAAAFKALGIAVTESNGQLRHGNAVFADIADRFSRLEDGATKTALAMQIFGKSGAEMIPLLNEGADGLKRYADESDRLGNTVSSKTAKAAEKFNDTLTTVQVAMQGVINQVMEGSLPALQSLADTFASPGFGTAIVNFTNLLLGVVNGLAKVAEAAGYVIDRFHSLDQQAASTLRTRLEWLKKNGGTPVGKGGTAALAAAVKARNEEIAKIEGLLGQMTISSTFDTIGTKTFGNSADMWASLKGNSVEPLVIPPFSTGDAVASLEPLDLGIETTTEKVETLADKIGGPLSDAFIGFADSIMAGVPPLQAFLGELGDIGKQLLNAGIRGLVNAALGGFSFGGAAPSGGFSFGGPTFDGGGYTGMGARSGGMDGKGGFLAMMHPDETVLDHTKGQGAGGLMMNFNISGSRHDAAEIARVVRVEAMRVYQSMQRNPDRR